MKIIGNSHPPQCALSVLTFWDEMKTPTNICWQRIFEIVQLNSNKILENMDGDEWMGGCVFLGLARMPR